MKRSVAEASTTEALRDALDDFPETKLHLIQHHANRAFSLAKQLLEEKVKGLAGVHYSRKPSGKSLRRWDTNVGSIRIDDGKLLIDVPGGRVEVSLDEAGAAWSFLKPLHGEGLTDMGSFGE
jgi:hypothetical protein